MAKARRPAIGVTMGDPAGIGPEIVVKALADRIAAAGRVTVIGDAEVLARTIQMLEARMRVRRVRLPGESDPEPGVLEVIDLGNVNIGALRVGQVQEAAGRAAFEYVQRAIDLALAGAVDAVVTAPVNKEALRRAGVSYVDHTAMLEGLTGCQGLLTLFVVDRLKIFFATRHVALREACTSINAAAVYSALVKADAALRRFGWLEARIAVAALNPHGGEGGLFGDEEFGEILPAIERARDAGVNAVGPIPADSVFHRCLRGDFAAVISLYHDQGHIAAKTFDFERTVSVTTGLPFVRTSVDHGTAFDIAGKGLASAVSMVEAIRVAADYTRRMWGYPQEEAAG